MKSESVRLNSDTLQRVRKYVNNTGHKIGGFIEQVVNEKLDVLEEQGYAQAMSGILGNAINSKKKSKK